MTVHKKLMQARIKLQGMKLNKSGENKFAGYKYFELGDFLPQTMQIFNDLGLASVVTFDTEYARLQIIDCEDGTTLTITSPMAEANLKGAHPIQNLGAVESYQRRYLWLAAMEIVEHDIIDASPQVEAVKKPEPKAEPKPPKKVEGKAGPWQITIQGTGEEPEWLDEVPKAVQLALDMATNADDVMNIFKVNKQMFDLVKEADQAMWKSLMTTFTETKKKFVKE